MNIMVFGPPASGRGKVGRALAKNLGLEYISAGEEMMKANKSDPTLSRYIEKGAMVPDRYANKIILGHLENIKSNFLIVGYPYNIPQTETFDKVYKLDAIVQLQLSKDQIIQRVLNRVTCNNCFVSFNLSIDKPKKIDTCDLCGGELVKREDDNPKDIGLRLETYRKVSIEVLNHYRAMKIPIITHDVSDSKKSPNDNANQILYKLSTVIH